MPSNFRCRVLFAVLPALAVFAPARVEASVYLVKDLATGSADAHTEILGSSGGLVYFVTGDVSGYSRVLWTTDGTTAGTEQIAVVAPPISYDARSLSFADVDGTAFFVNSSSGHPELWKSDGTSGGTVRVAPSTAVGISNLTKIGGELYFASAPPTSGTWSYDLWKSDGTEAGTEMIADIDFGGPMYDVDGVAWFKGGDAGGWEAWRSDGTAAGTYRVADIYPGAGSSHASGYYSIGGTTCFGAYEPTGGLELWSSDGTEAGTERVVDINGTSGNSITASLVEWNGKLYFNAYDSSDTLHLYSSDCTAAGTVALETLTSPIYLGVAGGRLYFEISTPAAGGELWTTDGTPGGAAMVRDIRPGAGGSSLGSLVSLGSFAYFSANDGTTGSELWRTNGTTAGTTRVADLVPGANGSDPGPMAVAGARLVMPASTTDGTRELWTSDGTAAGTSILADLSSGPSESSNPRYLLGSGGRVVFSASGNDSSGYWISNGTAAGTVPFTGVESPGFFDWNGTLVITSYSFGEQGIWLRSPGGTLTRISDESAGGFTPIGDLLYFVRRGKAFVTDGTPGGEIELASFTASAPCTRPFPFCSESGQTPSGFADLGNGTVLFLVWGLSAADQDEIWKTDGTTAGTSKVTDIDFGASYYSSDLRVLDGRLLFDATDAAHGLELWATDGTAIGTSLLADVEPGAAGSGPSSFILSGDRLFFTAATAAAGRELWSTDGTTVGTTPTVDIEPGPAHSYIEHLTAFGDEVLFSAQDSTSGREVWRSDGTTMGTSRITDLRPGPEGSGIAYLEAAGPHVYFRGSDGIAGDELWRTDGTEAGTELVADINPGGAWSWPDELTFTGGRLYFAATTFHNGTELWALDIAINCGNGTVDPGETCDDSNLVPGDGCDAECILETCGDGVLDEGEQCDDGNHLSRDGCSRACILDCPFAPSEGCRSPSESRASRLALKSNGNPSKSQLSWKWGRGDSSKEDFGDPTTAGTSFAICLYDAGGVLFDANIAGASTCGSGACWSEQTSGFSIKRKTSSGSLQMKLTGDPDPGRAKLGLKMRGNEISMPDLTQISDSISFRLHNELGCWGADFSPEFQKHTDELIKAESD